MNDKSMATRFNSILSLCCSVACVASTALCSEPLRLRLEDGSFSSGEIVGIEHSDRLGWKCDVFDKPFEFDLNAIRSVTKSVDADAENQAGHVAAGNQFFELSDGSLIVGQLAEVHDDWITVVTALAGKVKIDRSRTLAIVDAGYAGRLIYSGPVDDDRWQRLGEATDWEFEAGSLVAQKQGAAIIGNLQLPSKSQISLSLAWRGTPDFVVSLGTWATTNLKADEIVAAARLEVWPNQLAVVREVDGGADIAMLSDLSDANPRIDLTVYLDQDSGTVTVCDSHGRPWESLSVPSKNAPLLPSVHIANYGPSLSLERFEVREWDGVASTIHAQGDLSVLATSGTRIDGAIRGYDSKTQELQIQLASGELQLLPLNQLRRGDLFQANLPTDAKATDTEDGLPPSVIQPPALETDKNSTPLATPQTDEIAATAAKSSGSARNTAIDQPEAEHTIELVLMDRTRLKGRWLPAVDAQTIRFDADGLQESATVNVDAVRGIIGSPARYATQDSPSLIGTVKVGENQLRGFLAATDGNQSDSALLWHPIGSDVASSISTNTSGAIIYRDPLPKIEVRNSAEEPNKPVGVLAPAVGMFLGRNRVQAGNEVAKVPTKTGQGATIPDAREIMFRAGDAVDGVVERIDERGMTFRSAQTSTTFAPHNLIQHVWLNKLRNTTDTSPEKLARLMTVPRSMKNDPPTHLFIATTGDYLRGRLVRLEGDKVSVEIRLEQIEIPIANISQIVWLHDRKWEDDKGSTNNKSIDENSTDPQASAATSADSKADSMGPFLVHAIGKEDRGLTFRPQKVSDGVISGSGELLGDCAIAVADLRQMLFGRNIADQVRAFREDPWTLSLAQIPRVYMDDGSAPSGENSSLVGKPAPDFLLRSISGEAFRLSKQRDRIVVLDFWASWCGPCMQTMPLVDEVVAELGTDKIHLVAVNIQETAAKAQAAVDRLKVAATVLLDSDGQAAAAYAANAIPQTVIVDRNGLVTHVFVGGGPKFVAQLKLALQTASGTDAEKNTAEKNTAQ